MVSSLLCFFFTYDLYSCQTEVSYLAVIRGKVGPMILAFSINLKFKIILINLDAGLLLRFYPSKQDQRFLLTSKNLWPFNYAKCSHSWIWLTTSFNWSFYVFWLTKKAKSSFLMIWLVDEECWKIPCCQTFWRWQNRLCKHSKGVLSSSTLT